MAKNWLGTDRQGDSEIAGLDYDPVIYDQDRYDFYDTVDTAKVELTHPGTPKSTYLVHTGVPLLI